MTDPSAVELVVDSRCVLGEGPVWSARQRTLFWTDIEASRLWSHDAGGGTTRSWMLEERLGAIAECESGGLLLGFATRLAIARLDDAPAPGGLAMTDLLPVEPHHPTTRINDGRTDRAGHFVFGTLNEHPSRAPIGSFYQFSIALGLRRLALPGVAIPNSICFSLDGTTMYFCDSLDRRIMCCDYEAASARVGHVREFARLPDGSGVPDGSAIDAEGYLWNAEWGNGCVKRYQPNGDIDRKCLVPVRHPTSLVFGGPRLDELYVTSASQDLSSENRSREPYAGGVYRILPGVAGVAERRFTDA